MSQQTEMVKGKADVVIVQYSKVWYVPNVTRVKLHQFLLLDVQEHWSVLLQWEPFLSLSMLKSYIWGDGSKVGGFNQQARDVSQCYSFNCCVLTKSEQDRELIKEKALKVNMLPYTCEKCWWQHERVLWLSVAAVWSFV